LCGRLMPLALIALSLACSSDPTGGGGVFGGISLGNTALGGAGFLGYSGTGLPRDYSYLFARSALGEEAACVESGACGHGGRTIMYSDLPNSDSLLFVTTSNFIATNAQGVPVIAVVQLSGIQHDSITLPATPAGKRLRLSLEFAFLQSQATAGDSAVIQLVIDGSVTRVFRVAGSDLGASIPLRAGGCGSATIPITVSFPVCTDWQVRQIDLTPYRGKRTPIRFVVGESGRTPGRAVTLLIRRLRFESEQ
jgi:hypothetical protein